MRLGVRGRLALWYGVAVAVALVGYALAVLAFVSNQLGQELDRQLHDDFERAEHLVEPGADGRLRWSGGADPHDTIAFDVEVTTPGGELLVRQPAEASGPRRTFFEPYVVGGQKVILAVSRPLAPMRAQVLQLAVGFAGGLGPAVALAVLAGWVLAGRALAPVATMADRAAAITAERLSERLPVDTPHDELGRLATAFNATLARLERSFEHLRRFTSDASHELRTPLTALRSVGEVALREVRDAHHYREVIGSMLEEVERLTSLVDALLELARSDAGRVRVVRQDVDVLGLAREVAAQLSVLAEERGQVLTVDGSQPVRAAVDPVLIRRALGNLIDNAIRYGPPGSPIEVQVAAGDPITLDVVDTGPAIDLLHRDRIFERFYRVDPSRSSTGSGLGLALARRAIELHDGTLVLVDSGSGGNRFRIALPGGT